jgi:hypothetical protein
VLILNCYLLCVRINLPLIIILLFQAAQAATNVAKRLIPLFDRVLIQKAEAVTKTKGGIVIPEKAQAKVLHGTVVAVGPGSRNQVRDAERQLLYHIRQLLLYHIRQALYHIR